MDSTNVSWLAAIILVVLIVFLFLWWKLKKRKTEQISIAMSEHEMAADDVRQTMKSPTVMMPGLTESAIEPGKSTFVRLPLDVKPDLLDKGRQCFVALDINTIGLIGSLEPVEVSATRYCNGEAQERFSSYVRPTPLEDGTMPEVGGIEPQILAAAPEQKQVFATLVDFVGDDLLAAHNASFCGKLLVDACNRAGITRQFCFFDTLPMARTLYPSLKSHKLKTVVEYLKSEGLEEQSGDTDAVAAILNAYLHGKDA